jgi:REP element-mobilizing transposase RayT
MFGDLVDGEVRLSEYGEIVAEELATAVDANPNVICDRLAIMPNHFHVIFVFTESVGAIHESPKSPQSAAAGAIRELPLRMTRGERRKMELAKLVGRFKMRSAKRINISRGTPGWAVWQRNYHEHIIRDEEDLNRTREYIEMNPARWADDEEHPR